MGGCRPGTIEVPGVPAGWTTDGQTNWKKISHEIPCMHWLLAVRRQVVTGVLKNDHEHSHHHGHGLEGHDNMILM